MSLPFPLGGTVTWQSSSCATQLIHLSLLMALILCFPSGIDYRLRLKALLLGCLISQCVFVLWLTLEMVIPPISILPNGSFPGSIHTAVNTLQLIFFLLLTLAIIKVSHPYTSSLIPEMAASPTFRRFSRYWVPLPIGLTFVGIIHWLDPLSTRLPIKLELDDAPLQDIRGKHYPFVKDTAPDPHRKKRLWLLWRSDCLPCMRQLRDISRHYQRHPEMWEKLDLILVNEGDELLPMLRALPRNLPTVATMLWDKHSYLSAQLSLRALPITLLTDHEHRILQHQIGRWFIK